MNEICVDFSRSEVSTSACFRHYAWPYDSLNVIKKRPPSFLACFSVGRESMIRREGNGERRYCVAVCSAVNSRTGTSITFCVPRDRSGHPLREVSNQLTIPTSRRCLRFSINGPVSIRGVYRARSRPRRDATRRNADGKFGLDWFLSEIGRRDTLQEFRSLDTYPILALVSLGA